MFAALAIILVLAWVVGVSVFHVAGALIQILLFLAVISFLWHLGSGRRTAG
jgi:hypothetical protein